MAGCIRMNAVGCKGEIGLGFTAFRKRLPVARLGGYHIRLELGGEDGDALIHPRQHPVHRGCGVFGLRRDGGERYDLWLEFFTQYADQLAVVGEPLVEARIGLVDVRSEHIVHAEHHHQHIGRFRERGGDFHPFHIQIVLLLCLFPGEGQPRTHAHATATQRHQIVFAPRIHRAQRLAHFKYVARPEPASALPGDAVTDEDDARVSVERGRLSGRNGVSKEEKCEQAFEEESEVVFHREIMAARGRRLNLGRSPLYSKWRRIHAGLRRDDRDGKNVATPVPKGGSVRLSGVL